MVSEIGQNKGLVKTYWSDVRDRVIKVEPIFGKLVDELAPDHTFPIYLAYYPYGALTGDTKSPFMPNAEGGVYRLSDADAPKDVMKHLGYGKDSFPLGMVLEKEMEYFIDLKENEITIPWLILSAGMFFPFSRVLTKRNSRTYAPNGILSTMSGARSAFMLPNIGCVTNHARLQRDFNIKLPPPKSSYGHFELFKQLTKSSSLNCDWRSCIIYFSEKWVTKLHTDKAWLSLKMYLYELAWNRFDYLTNHIYYDIAFSSIQNRRNLKPNPYLADTAAHLFATALGAAPGYAPACNDDSLPLELLQNVFVSSYGLKKYHPTIMQPMHFILEKNMAPVYYSIQNPSTYVSSPKSREISNILFELRELEHIMSIFIDELSKDNAMCSDTIINKIAKTINFLYFHNKTDRHHVIKPSSYIIKLDKRFNYINPKYKVKDAEFASDATFLRGCIKVSMKD